MPLMNCPECSSEISDAASACPHCGYPLATEGPSSQVGDENTAQVSNSDEPEVFLQPDDADDIVARLHASLARRSRIMLAILAGLILLTTLIVVPLIVDGLVKGFDSAGISFSERGVFVAIVVVAAVLSGFWIIAWIAEYIAELEFFANPDDINWDELSSLERAEAPSLRDFWLELHKRYGGFFFNVSVSELSEIYVFNYKFRWGIGLAVAFVLYLKGLLT